MGVHTFAACNLHAHTRGASTVHFAVLLASVVAGSGRVSRRDAIVVPSQLNITIIIKYSI